MEARPAGDVRALGRRLQNAAAGYTEARGAGRW
jgi:hypothetical protein